MIDKLAKDATTLRNRVLETDDLDDAILFIANRIDVAAFLEDAGDHRQAGAAVDEAISYIFRAALDDPECSHLLGELLTMRARLVSMSDRTWEAIALAETGFEAHERCEPEECDDERGHAACVAAVLRRDVQEFDKAIAWFERAFEEWEKAKHADANYWPQWARLEFAKLLVSQGRSDEALAHLERVAGQMQAGECALELMEQNRVLELIVEQYFDRGRYEDAAGMAERLAQLRMTMEEGPERSYGIALALQSRAQSLGLLERYDEAHAVLQRAMELVGDEPRAVYEIYTRRRELYHDADDHERATKVSELLIGWFRMQDHDESPMLLEAVLADASLRLCAGEPAMALVSAGDAIEMIEAGIEFNALDAVAYAYLADAMIGIGQKDEALAMLPFVRERLLASWEKTGEALALQNAITTCMRERDLHTSRGNAEAAEAATREANRLRLLAKTAA